MLFCVLTLFICPASAQTDSSVLAIDTIMKGYEYIGTVPDSVQWDENSQKVYFKWKSDGDVEDAYYAAGVKEGPPKKASLQIRSILASGQGSYDRRKKRKVYEKDGDLYLLDLGSGKKQRITQTTDRETRPSFKQDDSGITFERDGNLFAWRLSDGAVSQLTDFRKGDAPAKSEKLSGQEQWIRVQQLNLLTVIGEKVKKAETEKVEKKDAESPWPKTIYVGSESVDNIKLSPSGTFVTFRLSKNPDKPHNTLVTDYADESGYARNLTARPKVGSPRETYRLGIYDIPGDSVYYVSTAQLPGITERFVVNPGISGGTGEGSQDSVPRDVVIHGPYWSDDGTGGFLDIRALDNKDRWLVLLDLKTGELKTLDRQHDEAWIAGPGISWWMGTSNIGWMPDNRRIWFHSEESGYSHLYAVDVVTGSRQALTSGEFEVYDSRVSNDGRFWYLNTNEEHPGERHYYRMPLKGGDRTRLTFMTGNNQVTLSPDEKWMAIRHSYSNQPWELYVQENKPGTNPRKITSSLSRAFKAYDWRDPEVITFTARDGANVYARLFRPRVESTGGPAVIFVHGAGYLQNAHRWWSSYYREYMFHNFLADHGYTVLDIDYRGSQGYGRDWRTAIYRHMGGKDLDDQVDGAKFLVDEFEIDPKKIGIYGGSYGGFITLMAMFKEPGMFAAGAALRSVTDWAHYNHTYTSNILNTPVEDSLAFVRSSPIYFAEGLEGALLICHGMVDVNVQFQDVVRLAQRLIELGKENWELAVYPVEGHGFTEQSSWADEYTRIFRLFEQTLK